MCIQCPSRAGPSLLRLPTHLRIQYVLANYTWLLLTFLGLFYLLPLLILSTYKLYPSPAFFPSLSKNLVSSSRSNQNAGASVVPLRNKELSAQAWKDEIMVGPGASVAKFTIFLSRAQPMDNPTPTKFDPYVSQDSKSQERESYGLSSGWVSK